MTHELRPVTSSPQVYLYRQPVDFRLGYRGLSAIVELELNHNPFESGLYVFINRQRNKIKCLFWDRNGFVLYYKTLAEEKFHWPKHDEAIMTVTRQQIQWLLEGVDITQVRGHKTLNYETVF